MVFCNSYTACSRMSTPRMTMNRMSNQNRLTQQLHVELFVIAFVNSSTFKPVLVPPCCTPSRVCLMFSNYFPKYYPHTYRCKGSVLHWRLPWSLASPGPPCYGLRWRCCRQSAWKRRDGLGMAPPKEIGRQHRTTSSLKCKSVVPVLSPGLFASPTTV